MPEISPTATCLLGDKRPLSALFGEDAGRRFRLDPGIGSTSPVVELAKSIAPFKSDEGAVTVTAEECAKFPNSELIPLYYAKKFHLLSAMLFMKLVRYGSEQILALTPEIQNEVDEVVGALLFVLSRPDFEISNELIPQFVSMNHVLCNVIRISSYRTSDPWVKQLMRQERNLAKLLILYNVRCETDIDPTALVNAQTKLGSLWYTRYSLGVGGYAADAPLEKIRRCLANVPESFVMPDTTVTASYFNCTYVDHENDWKYKSEINKRIQRELKDVGVRNKPRRNSVAIITSKWWPQTAVYKSCAPFINTLSDEYDLTLVHTGPDREGIDKSIFNRVLSVKLEGDKLDFSQILENDFQLAYFPDIGMTAESIWLANMRIAPIQAMGYGHPVSTYGALVDYFIGGADAELPVGAEKFYSERLVLIPGIGQHPVLPQYEPKRPEPKDDLLRVNCAWGCTKINAPLLRLMREIRDRSNKPMQFQFFPAWGLERYNAVIPFLQDIEAALGTAAHVYANRPYNDYMSCMENSALAIDSFPFGGYNNIVDSLFLRIPLVSFQGDRFYNRAASALLRKVDLEELIATNGDEYVEKTVRLINDDDYRHDVRDRIAKIDLQERLFNTDEPPFFKDAINFIIDHHEQLSQDTCRTPIFIR